MLVARHVRDVLAEHHDPGISPHLVFEALVEQIHHRGWAALELWCVLGVEGIGRRVHVGRVHVLVNGVRGRLGRGERNLGGELYVLVHLGSDLLDLGLGRHTVGDELGGERDERIPLRLLLALPLRLVVHLVVGQRVRVGPYHVCVDQRGALARPAVRRGRCQHVV